MRNNEIHISWSKPLTFEEVFFHENIEDKGLYCISRIYDSSETIIYIGKATNTFKSRLKSHGRNWVDKYRGDKLVRLGTVVKRPFTERVITHAENALIYEVQPQQNTMSTRGYTYKHEYVVVNSGSRGDLPAKVDMKKQK